jgi:N-acetylmuramoyl-L-alanine amidase
MRKINNIVLHCTAGPQTQTVEVIQAYWRSIGWKTDGYHHIIKPDGTIVDLVPIEKPSNGVAGHNADSIHICYIGGVEVKKGVNDKGKPINVIGKALDNRTPEQIISQIQLIVKYKEMFPNAKVLGHRDFSPDKNRDGIIQPSEWMKTCPSFSVREWLDCVGLQNK